MASKQHNLPVNVISNAVGLSMLCLALGDTGWLQTELTVTLIGATLVQIYLNADYTLSSLGVTKVNIVVGLPS